MRPTWQQIAKRAFDIWVRKGKPSGQDMENWLEAEAELRAEPNAYVFAYEVKPKKKKTPPN